jgi:hypothetical protein
VSALEAFHLQTILDRGTALLASGGKVSKVTAPSAGAGRLCCNICQAAGIWGVCESGGYKASENGEWQTFASVLSLHQCNLSTCRCLLTLHCWRAHHPAGV